jgi:predicted short-subunit dehydrogenase-like oxidoreductase (DUF2520 family)
MTLVGAGPVGVTLASLLCRSGHRAAAVISRSLSSARRAARTLRAGSASTSVGRIPRETRLLLIAVPDDEIGPVAETIARTADLPWDSLVAFHCSGLGTSELLEPLAAKGAPTFALHPIQSFPPARAVRDQLLMMKGVFYGFQGPRRFAPLGRRIVKDLGGRMIVIPKDKKILYHTACVFASNYPVVLLDIVEDLARAVSPHIRLEAFRPLTESSVAHAMALSPARALTGPVARASVGTVEQHRRELAKENRELDELYRRLALVALHMAKRQGRLRAADVRNLMTILRRRS